MVRHRATARFWKAYHALPADVREVADRCFRLLRESPEHPSLRFKRIEALWTARVGLHHRALAEQNEGGFTWVWIGTHSEYDKVLNRR